MHLSVPAVVDCGPPPVPKNGSTSAPDGTTFNLDVWYSCSDGFELVGSESSRCLADGQWSIDPPTCKRTFPSSTSIVNISVVYR